MAILPAFLKHLSMPGPGNGELHPALPAHLLVWWFGSALTVSRVVYSFANLPCERIPTG